MTDTGQVPGEGQPESAGMVEQPGVPAHGAYTYLSEAPAEDEDLLLPGAQGAWGNEVPPPAPEPVVEAVHQPGPHETAGRDSGSVDLSGVRLPSPAPASAVSSPILSAPHDPAAAQQQARRPLHLGPPIPDASASPVRSLADRGPAGAPVRQPGPQTAGPEYFEAQPLRDMAPQSAAPWGAAPAAHAPADTGTAPDAAVQAGAQAPAAETVDPAAVPVADAAEQAEQTGAAQATIARLATQAAAQAPAQVVHGHDGVQPAHGHDGVSTAPPEQGPEDPAAEAGPAAGAPGRAEAAVAPEAAPDGQPVEGAAVAPEEGVTPAVAEAGQTAEAPADTEAAVPVQEAGTAEPGPGAQKADVQDVPADVPAEAIVPVQQVVPVQHADPVQQADPAQPTDPAQHADPVQQPVPVQQPDAAPQTVQPVDATEQSAGEQTADATQAPVPAEAVVVTEPGTAGAGQAAAEATPEVADAQQTEPPVVAAEDAAQPEEPAAGPAAGVAELPEAQPAAGQPVPEAVAVPVTEPTPVQPAEPAAPSENVTPVAVPEESAAEETGAEETGAEETAAGAPVPQALVAAPAEEAVPVPTAVEAEGAPQPHPLVVQDPQQAGPAEPAAEALPTAPLPQPSVHPEPQAHPDTVAQAAPEQTVQPLAPAGPQTLPAEQAPVPAPAEETTAHLGTAAAIAGAHPETLEQPAPADAPAADVAPVPQPEQPLGRFVPVDGQVPTTPHLAPTPPQPLVLPADRLQDLQGPQEQPEPVAATVPAPREGEPAVVPAAPDAEHPDVVQHADDLRTRAADQEESTADVAEAERSTGPAAPGYDDAEREAVLKVMRERRDIRNGFRGDPIPHEVLLRVLEAAHTAPSVGHSQPWDFVVIRSAETRRTMHELAMRQREAYAKSLPKGRAKQFKELKIEAILDTPVNIVVTADPTRGGRHTLGRHTQPQMAPYSSALAVENLWLAARAEGLGVGWVSFFDEREMVRSLGLPEHLEVVAYLCVGYVDEFPDEPELMQAGWSKRRPLSWVVHEETYGRRALPGEEPHDLLAETVAQIRPLDAKALGEAWERQKRMTKPAGALGMLEIISAQLSGLSRQCPPPIPEPAAVAIFAGDHGVHAQGVTPWPQEVTAQMVANFLGGGAVCNAFANQVGAEVCVVDVGVVADLPATPGLLPRKIRGGTSDMTTGPAMTREEAKAAIEVGIETARDLVAAGNKALLTGEMGIANTTASAALISVFTGADPAEVTGRGTGINDETLARKTDVVRRALEFHQPDPADPVGVLAAIGGFEHAAMVGLLLGGASLRTPVILDGVSAGAAALVARAIAPEVLAACIAGHRSAEPGHVAALNKLGLRPLVDLDLRLGEGTGALLALPLVQSTARAMHEVATFDSAGVTEK
ncbi:nicotinate-nucleotide--dimethylbenzimidazole phosphoribosyltransferase [Streptomyces sp. IBSBF 2390]|uniref:nicotinate-nucleotide--dimethylbenzimidazole phosphoribosyltransferase n=1 Tax=Streptomyces sp. IBSBF 2390 TaxID=2903533 RepID=UPI002FDB98E3